MDSYLCENCVKDIWLNKLISENGHLCKKCSICSSTEKRAMSCEDSNLSHLFKALIRYNYSEWEYNGHLGGEFIENLFSKENPILNFDNIIDVDNLETVVLTLIDPVYEDYDSGISLYAGYDENGQQNKPLVALKMDYSSKLKKLADELKRKNHFLLEEHWLSMLIKYTDQIKGYIKSDSSYYRARIGFDKKAIPVLGDWNPEHHYKPFSGENIGAPPPYQATSGRMNRSGVSFLYLASDPETALVETRPFPSQIVSIGQFKSKREFQIVDLVSVNIFNYFESDEKMDDYLFLKSIEHIFSIPVPPDQIKRYTITQFLSDILRKLEFDGVAFKSSIGPGSNLTVFNPDNFHFVNDDSHVVRVNKLQYFYAPLPEINPEEDYYESGNWQNI